MGNSKWDKLCHGVAGYHGHSAQAIASLKKRWSKSEQEKKQAFVMENSPRKVDFED